MRIDHRASEGATLPAAIEQLRATLSGQLVTPGDAEYDAARRVHNGMIDRYPRRSPAAATSPTSSPSIALATGREAAGRRPERRPQRRRAWGPSTTASSSTSRR